MENIKVYAKSADRVGIAKAVEEVLFKALSSGEVAESTIKVEIPQIEVICPKSDKLLQKEMTVEVNAPGRKIKIPIVLSEMEN